MAASGMDPKPAVGILAHPKFHSRPDRAATWMALRAVYQPQYWRHMAMLRAGGIAAPADLLRRLKLPKRFTTGGCLGWAVSRCLSPADPFGFHLRRGKIFSLWGSAVIASDWVADDAQLSRSETMELFVRLLMAMTGVGGGDPPSADVDHLAGCVREHFGDVLAASGDGQEQAPHASALLEGRRSSAAFFYPRNGLDLRNLSLGLGRQLFDLQDGLRDACSGVGPEARHRDAFAAFRRLACEGFRGQLDSLALGTDDERLDWRWYAERLLNQKTLNFFLAPLALCAAADAGEERRRADLAGAFRQLNACYLHWQILDDIRDSPRDLKAGLAGAPLLVLISQGRVAGAVASDLARIDRGDADGAAARSAVLKVLLDSWLLHPRYFRARDASGIPAGMLEAMHAADDGARGTSADWKAAELARLALSNTPADAGLAVAELARRAVGRLGRLRELRRANAGDELVALVRESGVCRRFLDTVGNPDYRGPHEAALEAVADPELLEAIRAMRRFMHRSWRFARIEGGRPEPGRRAASGRRTDAGGRR